jgi:hypothetical protein
MYDDFPQKHLEKTIKMHIIQRVFIGTVNTPSTGGGTRL